MKKLSLSVIFILFASLVKLEAAEYDTFCCSGTSNPLYNARVEAGYSAGQFIGIKQGYADLGLFVPFYLTDSLVPFIEVRGYRFNNSKWGLSSGIGLRKCLGDNQVIGANVYYDYLEGRFHKSFNRLGFGFEWLGECLDFRVNTYFPLGNQVHSSEKEYYNDYIGSYHATSRENQYSIAKGFDAEVGGCFCWWNNFTLYGAVGPYYYSSKQKNSYFGGQARIELSYNSLFSIQIRSSYDSVNRSRTQGQIQLSVPFEILSGNLTNYCQSTILKPVRRNGVIFTKDCCDYTWNW